MYYVYKYVQNNQIVYIGITNNLDRRFKEHLKEDNLKNSKIFYFSCNSKAVAENYEFFLINKYHPVFNTAKQQKDFICDIIEPDWSLYSTELIKNIEIETNKEKNNIDQFVNENPQNKKVILSNFKDTSLLFQKIILYLTLKSKQLNIGIEKVVGNICEFCNLMDYSSSGNYPNVRNTIIQNNIYFIKLNDFEFILSEEGKKIVSLLNKYSIKELLFLLHETKSKYSLILLNLLETENSLSRETCIANCHYGKWKEIKRNFIQKSCDDLAPLFNYSFLGQRLGRLENNIIFTRK